SRRCSTSACRASASYSGCSPIRRSGRPPCSREHSWAFTRGASSFPCRARRTRAVSRSRSSSFRSCPTSSAKSVDSATSSCWARGVYSISSLGGPMSRSCPVALLSVVALAVKNSGPMTGRTSALAPASAAPELARVNTLLADLAERLRPGLVHVRVQRATSAPDDAPREEPVEPRRSTGSGFVIDASGLIVTNAHVVDGATTIQLRLADGRRLKGTVVGRDNRVHLALLKIDGATNRTVLLPQLASKGRVDWGWLGVAISEVTDDDVERLKLREARGLLVRRVMPGEPADQGGVRADDVIISIDGLRLETPRDLQRVVSSTPVGKRVRVALLRDGLETEVE